MKSFKYLVAGLLFAVASLGASAQNKFINDQLDNNAAASGAKIVNVAKIAKVRLSGGLVNITKLDGTTEVWTGSWTIFDRFVSGPRNQGSDFAYYQDSSSGDHIKVSYSVIASAVCTSSPFGGTTKYDLTIKYTAEAGGGTLVATSLSSNLCSNLN